MQASYYSSARALLGLQVDYHKLMELPSSCGHEKPAGANFCPECGKPSGSYDESSKTIAGYSVLLDVERLEAYVCGASASDERPNGPQCRPTMLTTDMIADIRIKMRNSLKPLGLWDERSFGLYSVLVYHRKQ